MHRLSKACPGQLGEAQTVVGDMVRQRLQGTGGFKIAYVQAGDVLRAIEIVKSVESRLKMGEMGGKADGGGEGDAKSKDADAVDAVDRAGMGDCGCPRNMVDLIAATRTGIPNNEEGLAAVHEARQAGLMRLCRRHLRLLAASSMGLCNNTTSKKIRRRLELVCRNSSRLEALRRKKPRWFRQNYRPALPEDTLGTCKYPSVRPAEFEFDEMQLFERFAGPKSWENWKKDGTINVPGVFSYLGEAGLREMIDTEFSIYRHHHHTPAGTSRLGWLRNMYYSLVQQLARQDPVWYALTVAARPDKHWRLISYPYITKDTDANGEETGFLHLDLNLEAFMKNGQGGNRLTSSLSLDDEEEDGCTVVAKGFHEHIRAWFLRLQQRGWKGSGPTTNCSSAYQAEDRAEWGEPVGLPCPAWGIRITLPQLIHGSTPVSRQRRRTVLPWYTHIDANHEKLEIPGCLSWSEIRQCHLDLEVPGRDPSGYGPRLGAPKERFGGSVVLGSTSALGDALVGRRKWTDVEVIRERNILLGPDSDAAQNYIMNIRARLVEQYRIAFISMEEAEKKQFGRNSYFVVAENRNGEEGIAGLEDERSDSSDDSLGSLSTSPAESDSENDEAGV